MLSPESKTCSTTKRPLGYPKGVLFGNHDGEAEDNVN